MIYTYWLHEKIQTDFNEAFAWYEDKQEGFFPSNVSPRALCVSRGRCVC